MHRVECHAILKHLSYLWWCLCDAWEDYWCPPCKECGLSPSKIKTK